jgi:prepilin-type N-terminal cleavage/methylation domain-containing protein
LKIILRQKSDNRGFTLVEIIVVLVILSILAAILIPTMMGFFDIFETDEIEENVDTIKKVSQVKLFDMYSEMAYNQDNLHTIMDSDLLNTNLNEFKDCDIQNSEFAKEIMNELNIGDDSGSPNIVFLLLGRFDYYTDITNEAYDPIKAYTIYDVVYQHKENDKIYYYCDGKLLDERNIGRSENKKYNTIKYDGETVYVQYYLLKSYKNSNNQFQKLDATFWTHFRSQYTTYNGYAYDMG